MTKEEKNILRSWQNNIRYTYPEKYRSDFVRFAIGRYAAAERTDSQRATTALLAAGLSASGVSFAGIVDMDACIGAMAVNRCHTKQKILCDLVLDGLESMHLKGAYTDDYLTKK